MFKESPNILKDSKKAWVVGEHYEETQRSYNIKQGLRYVRGVFPIKDLKESYEEMLSNRTKKSAKEAIYSD
jgi:hypothetical protein